MKVVVPFYFDDEVYLVTALVPSETACLASSPGRSRRTAVWTSREEMVFFLLYIPSRDGEASLAILSKMSLTKEFSAFPNTKYAGESCFHEVEWS